ncbi:MAG: hypothetical protein JWM56_1186, partial [Candidatus Peribacteria bacterium]|nr:hypothetical protein [Candidatus Peribacteria bacterium]
MKKNTFPCWPALLSLTILCMPLPAHGQSIVAETLANISGALFTVVTPETSNCYGQYCAFIGLADALVFRVRPILILIAGLLIAIQGYRMVIGQEDEVTGKAKATVTACLAGIVLLFLYRPFIQAFYGNMGSVLNNSNVSVGANI